MANKFEISKLNPLRTIWKSDKTPSDSGALHYQAFNPAFNQYEFDGNFFYNSIRFYEQKQGYIQPYQQSDTIIYQFLADNATHTRYSAAILDHNGASTAITLDNATYQRELASLYGGMSVYVYTIPLYNIPEGRYFLQVQYYDGVSDSILLITEPFHVKQHHPNTVRIDYWNSFNDWSYIFEANVVPQIRLHGCIAEVTPASKFKVYEDQPLNVEMVSGIAYRQYLLAIGIGIKDVPEWVVDKLERMLLCDLVKIDGHAYTREEGSKWEGKPQERIPLGTYTLKLRDRYNTDTVNVSDWTDILNDMPQTRFFYIEDMTINGSTVNIRKGFNGKRNFLDYLNATHLVTKGYWAESASNKLVFVFYEGQTAGNNVLTNANILAYGVRVIVKGTGDLVVSVNVSGFYAVIPNGGLSQTNKTALSGALSITKTYTGSGTEKEFYFYFSNGTTFIAAAGNTVTWKTIGGDLPPAATTFSLSLGNGSVTGIENNLFRYVTAITYIDLSDQQIGTHGIDDIIMWCYDSLSRLSGSCTIYMTQVPAAPPSNSEGIGRLKAAVKAAITTLTTD